VKDMVELIDALEAQGAVWIGHDWGSPVAWNMALHHPDRVAAVASLCVPFGFVGNPEHMEHSIDRTLYPADEYPCGPMGLSVVLLRELRQRSSRNGAGPRARG
jgi:pimeloyl-ACP methyl ester carboxylesterase